MKKVILLVLACMLAQTPAFGEVTDSAPGGFTIKIVSSIQASPAEVYRRFFQVADWWDSAHSFSRDAHNLSMEQRAMGCFCEKLPNGGAVRHMEVIFLSPGKRIRLSGGLGPFQGMATAGTMNFELSDAEGGTKLEFTYAVSGYSPNGLDKVAPAANQMLTEQLTRLKSYIETGNPAGRKTEPKG